MSMMLREKISNSTYNLGEIIYRWCFRAMRLNEITWGGGEEISGRKCLRFPSFRGKKMKDTT